ncbi:hypothetical protein KP509_1Z324700 [Ceratopteris richardii]|nr:hypothetical protein KP509_1Z324700 [Ceratopteris richardii]
MQTFGLLTPERFVRVSYLLGSAVLIMSSRFPAFFFIIGFLCALNSFSAAQLDDQAPALLSIKSDVGASSPNLTSWNAASNGGPCADKWAGVVCDESNRITGLNMSGFYLEGKFASDAFSKFTDLKSIDVSNNKLESPFPSLDNLKNLHRRVSNMYFVFVQMVNHSLDSPTLIVLADNKPFLSFVILIK